MNKILLIDDDRSVSAAMTKVLRGAGYEVETAATADRAVACFSAQSPDLVLLDLGLPDRSGWDVYEELVRIDPLVPIVVVTAWPGQLTMARAAGIGALVEKPADPEKLLALMGRLLEEPEMTRLERLVNGRPPTRLVKPDNHRLPDHRLEAAAVEVRQKGAA